MKAFFSGAHAKQTIQLAWPLIITQVGHIITGMVDNIFLGRIGTTEQAAGILSNNLYVLILVFSIGISYSATPLVTAAHEKNDLLRKASLFKNSLLLNFFVAIGCFIVLYSLSPFMKYMQQPGEVVELAIPFFNVLIFSMLPVSFFFACKQYCEGLSNTRMALLISVSGNIINIILNYALIYGEAGFPKMGYMGSAWASFIARAFMGGSFMLLVFWSSFSGDIRAVFGKVQINMSELSALWKIGFNSAMQFTFEVAAFVMAGLMAGSFGAVQIDAHGIAMSIAAFTYMFGSGIGSAATIRVGIFKAQADWKEIAMASKEAIKLVVVIMGAFALLLAAFNHYLPRAFSTEHEIVLLAGKLLIVAALFQLFDGLQVTIIGILRGLQDVKVSTWITLFGYWIFALPVAYFFAFTLQLETIGIWLGLLASLVMVSGTLYLRLRYLLHKNLRSADL